MSTLKHSLGWATGAFNVRSAEQNRTERHIRVVLQRWRRGMARFFHFVLTLPPSFSRSLSPCSSHLSVHLHTSGTGMDTLLDKGSSVHNTGGGTFHCAAIGCYKLHISLFTPSKKHKEVYFLTRGGLKWCYMPQKLWARAALRKLLIQIATDLVGQLQSSVLQVISYLLVKSEGHFKSMQKTIHACIYTRVSFDGTAYWFFPVLIGCCMVVLVWA